MMSMLDELRTFFPGAIIRPVGSRVTCSPPPTDTDEDYLAYAISSDDLIANGFTEEGTPEFYTGNDNGGFRSYRRGSVNIIATENHEFFERFLTATALAKRLNLISKADRIALFQAVLYGVPAENLETA